MPDQKPVLEVRFVGDLQRLEIKPGDRFVLSVPHPCDANMAGHIQAAWRQFADETPLLILDGDMKLGAVASPPEG